MYRKNRLKGFAIFGEEKAPPAEQELRVPDRPGHLKKRPNCALAGTSEAQDNA
jgi:hypothetical protein